MWIGNYPFIKNRNSWHLCRYNALMPTDFSKFKTVLKVNFRNGFHLSDWFSSIDSKWCSGRTLLRLLCSQKSHCAKSCEYGGCGTIWFEFFGEIVAKNQCSMAWRIIVVLKPKVVLPEFRPLKMKVSIKRWITLKNTACRQFDLVEGIQNAQHNKCRHYKNRKIHF